MEKNIIIDDKDVNVNPNPDTDDEKRKDRIDEIISHLNSDDASKPLPEHLRRKQVEATPEALEELEKSLSQHPFFITQDQINNLSPSEPLPPLLESLQQLKYSADENSELDLALCYKTDALFQFRHGKYRIAATIFTEAIKHAESHKDDVELIANLYNNRGVCSFYIQNYRTALTDFSKALEIKPDYAKSWKKSMECCSKLERYSEGIEILKNGLKVGLKDEWGLGNKLKLELKHATLHKIKADSAKREMSRENQILLEKIRQAGIKMLNPRFLEQDNEAVVKLNDDERLQWPVLVYYPEHSTSDFIKEFDEYDSFLPHLKEILDNDSPAWDKNKEYKSDQVSVHYVDGVKGGWVEVDPNAKLVDIMRQERYHLPTNGVPGFFVLSKSEFCRFFLERMGTAE